MTKWVKINKTIKPTESNYIGQIGKVVDEMSTVYKLVVYWQDNKLHRRFLIVDKVNTELVVECDNMEMLYYDHDIRQRRLNA